jgi:hypothetical protein
VAFAFAFAEEPITLANRVLVASAKGCEERTREQLRGSEVARVVVWNAAQLAAPCGEILSAATDPRQFRTKLP